MNDVQELLGRVADESGPPTVTTDAVYAKAARVRWRRRAAVSAAALAVVAAGAVAVPGLTQGTRTETSSVAAPTPLAAADKETQRIIALLPKDVGQVAEVNLLAVIKNVTGAQAKHKYTGPLDGEYAVRRDGGIGYLTVRMMDEKYIEAKLGHEALQDLCAVVGNEPPRADCVREELPDGRVLTIWSDPMDDTQGTPQWGPELVGRLVLTDGTMLAVRDSTGFEGERSQGPLLDSPPLSREQLRALMLSPELLPKK